MNEPIITGDLNVDTAQWEKWADGCMRSAVESLLRRVYAERERAIKTADQIKEQFREQADIEDHHRDYQSGYNSRLRAEGARAVANALREADECD